jgi:TyrR family helix-turn-helix protein
MNLDEMVESFEKNIIQYACEKHGSTRKAAKAIGISQTQLVRKKSKYNII